MIKPQFSQFVLSVHCMLGIELGNMHRAYYPPSENSQTGIGTR